MGASAVLGKVVLNTSPIFHGTYTILRAPTVESLGDLSVLIPVSSVENGLFYSRALHFGDTSERPRNVRRKETAAQCLQEIGEENQLEGTNISS